jgi:hypothetical protein
VVVPPVVLPPVVVPPVVEPPLVVPPDVPPLVLPPVVPPFGAQVHSTPSNAQVVLAGQGLVVVTQEPAPLHAFFVITFPVQEVAVGPHKVPATGKLQAPVSSHVLPTPPQYMSVLAHPALQHLPEQTRVLHC